MAEGDWMPRSWPGKAAMFGNVRAKIGGYATVLGLSAAEVTAAEELCDEFTAVYEYYTSVQAASAAMTAWRDLAMTGKPEGKDLPVPPLVAAFTMPPNSLTGLLNIFRGVRDGWVSRSGYTDAIGDDLMIAAAGGEARDPSEVTPLLRASAAQNGYLIGVTVSGRGQADQWVVEVRQNGGSWQNAGSYTGKTADVHITPTNPGQPELVDIRVRLRRKNADYGNPSQIATVTVNP